MHRKNIRALSLIVCTFTYLMIGAAVFDALESETEMKRRSLTRKLEDKMKTKYKFSDEDYRILKTAIIKYFHHWNPIDASEGLMICRRLIITLNSEDVAVVFHLAESNFPTCLLMHPMKTLLESIDSDYVRDYGAINMGVKGIPHKAGFQWQFSGAFYFATVVITTVGYGHSTPATAGGKAFCIFYAMAGIPLGLVMFQSIGERLNTLISYMLSEAKKQMAIPGELSPTHLIFVSSSVGTLIIFLGTYVFHRYESWSPFDAFYYCFITLTTIGFGDFVALQKKEKLNSDLTYVIFTLVFILFGLAVFSASVNLFVLRFMATGTDHDHSDKEPQKHVYLENFSHSSGSDENNGRRGVVRSEYMTKPCPKHPRQGFVNNRPRRLLCGLHGANNGLKVALNKHEDGKYTVRRKPSKIAHLVPFDNHPHNTPSETDSFILHQLEASRRTTL